MKRQEVFETLDSIDAGLSENPHAVVLLASAVVGPNADKVSQLSGLSRAKCRRLAKEMRVNGLWVGNSVIASQWTDEETGGVGFILDVLVAEGKLERELTPAPTQKGQ